ncbi:MAG: histidinol dehydrogenase [Actinobacteria bacterium]|nr:histidinol dehydrogenase [Actinomycetota bacterium]
MLRRIDLRGYEGDLVDVLPRPIPGEDGPLEAVRAIIDDVRVRGDEAIREMGERFDGVRPGSLVVGPDEMSESLSAIDIPLRTALEVAAGSIRLHHEAQARTDHEWERDGLSVRSRAVPVDRAGCYVPGGRASYPSTVLMTAIPAGVAGVGEVVVCVPPGPDGRIADVTLAAAAVAGADVVHPVGGAQAIAALAYGTESIRPVDVVVGPGNVYVALAKREVAGRVGVPSAFAGPSEVVVVADATAPVGFAAIDMVVQAEHGPDGLAWLVTFDESVADAVEAEIAAITEASRRRNDIESTLAVSGLVVLVEDVGQAAAVVNHIAPEHLQLMVGDPQEVAAQVRHAGAVFCGPWSPASLGDYVAGPSHVLPTAGTARFAGALSLADFTRDVHVVTADRSAVAALGPHVVVLAEAEGLDAHAESLRRRLAAIEGGDDV